MVKLKIYALLAEITGAIMVIACLLLGACSAAGPDRQDVLYPEAAGELLTMVVSDQEIRERWAEFIRSFPGNPMQSPEYKVLADEMTAIDKQNLAGLERIIAAIGWPDNDKVGEEASNAAFLILQHSDTASQKKYLELFRASVLAGKGSASSLAMLTDRIRTSDDMPQVYGSTVVVGPDGIARLLPIEDVENVDTRRAEVGLPPLEEYLTLLEQQLGMEIQRK